MKKLLKGSSKNATVNSYCNCDSVGCKSSTYCNGYCDNTSIWTSAAYETQNTYDHQWGAKVNNTFK